MAENQTQGKKFPLMTVLVLAGVFLLEAAGISAVFLLAGGPADVEAGEDHALAEAARMEQPVEELVIADKFQNTLTGRAYIYDTEVYIRLRRKHQGQVQAELQAMGATISQDVGTIFRSAEPGHLLEPTLATIRRQIKAVLDERLGMDDQGESMVMEVLIPKCSRFKADL